jgi:phosphatidylinositol N-acetylglucosaminyltransferase subunit A
MPGDFNITTKHKICLVSDFFYPNFGGVETHIWCLAQCLIQRGHKVIVVTHVYGNRVGIRYMTNGLKVYYLPLTVCFDQVIFPTLHSFFFLFRNILTRERITIVHGHQSVSVMTCECLFYARALGYRTCFTDHSLFGFEDFASLQINRILEITLSDVDHVICVSHTCRENLALRAKIHPNLISTIPNAVDTTKFSPDTSKRLLSGSIINVIVMSRLVFRKGIDLLVQVIPLVCSRIDHVNFIIGGDGPKLLLLEEMREHYQLHDRVELLGAVPHSEVRSVLTRGHVFLNCSLTESFCIALLEAASCGLFVVSTKVGGVPEVLPPTMIRMSEPNVEDLTEAVLKGINQCRRIDPEEFHDRVQSMYNWIDVAKRIEGVYNHISTIKRPSLTKRLMRYLSTGYITGSIVCFIVVLLHFLKLFADYMFPIDLIEICPDIRLDQTRLTQKEFNRLSENPDSAVNSPKK